MYSTKLHVVLHSNREQGVIIYPIGNTRLVMYFSGISNVESDKCVTISTRDWYATPRGLSITLLTIQIKKKQELCTSSALPKYVSIGCGTRVSFVNIASSILGNFDVLQCTLRGSCTQTEQNKPSQHDKLNKINNFDFHNYCNNNVCNKKHIKETSDGKNIKHISKIQAFPG